ncbi:hypothetical protein [Actinoplanes sp. NPDC051851]|uniref:MarR family winged helix-turn-helix transcriptional regulator n=1 Tax=Actinoplanes sp. NPDC051851 TaxID=3154753 RepID=UPI003419D77F
MGSRPTPAWGPSGSRIRRTADGEWSDEGGAPASRARMLPATIAAALDWEKSRVAHQLTRMESRDLVSRTDHESNGRRTGVGLTGKGREAAENAVLGHGENIRRHFFAGLTGDQAAVLREWSRSTIGCIAAGEAAC